jgi:predicted metallo-beta-lactamase superfamily hydrolase
MGEGTRPMQRSITIPDIYLRWRVTVILIEKKYTELRTIASNATKQIASAHHVWRKRHN